MLADCSGNSLRVKSARLTRLKFKDQTEVTLQRACDTFLSSLTVKYRRLCVRDIDDRIAELRDRLRSLEKMRKGHCLDRLCDVSALCSGKSNFRHAHLQWEKRLFWGAGVLSWSIKGLSWPLVRIPEFESHLYQICVVLGSAVTSLRLSFSNYKKPHKISRTVLCTSQLSSYLFLCNK